MWIRTEEIRGVRRKYFASGHVMSRGGGKGMATAQVGQSARPEVPRAGGVSCIVMGRERMDVHHISTSQVLSNVCFLMQMTASWKPYSATLFSYPRLQAFQCC